MAICRLRRDVRTPASAWRSACLFLLASLPGCAHPATPPRTAIDLPGVRIDGRVQLPNQWSLKPTGQQVLLGDFPVNMALCPTGGYIAVLHAGYSTHEVMLLELSARGADVRSRSTLGAAFYGLCWSADGKRLYCSGGPKERVESFEVADGQLGQRRGLDVLPSGQPSAACVPAGLALSNDGRTLYVAGNRGHEIVAIDTVNQTPPVRVRLSDDSFPYACVIDETHTRLYVSLWGKSCIAVLNLPVRSDSTVTATWPTEDHPNEMLLTRDGSTLYVANANRNTVSVIDTTTGRSREILSSALYPDAPNGSTPNSIALSPDEKTLYIANADNNNVAVMDVSQPGVSRSKGFIPVGWYPTSVRISPDGKQLLVANGKGVIPKANRAGLNPLRHGGSSHDVIEQGLIHSNAAGCELSLQDVIGPNDRLQALDAGKVILPPENFLLGVILRIAHLDAQKETIQLGFG